MYQADEQRYDKMVYKRVGKSGLKLSALSLGSGIILAALTNLKIKRPLFTRRLTVESLTLIWPTITVRLPAVPKPTSAGLWPGI